MRVSVSQLNVCRPNPGYLMPSDFRRAYSPADGLAVKDPGKKKVQLVHCRLSYTEEDRKQEVIGGSVKNLFSSQPSYRSCIYHEVPLRCTRSFVFLDKPLCISLVELQGKGACKPALCRSTLSIRLGTSSCHRSSKDSKPAKRNEGYAKSRAAMLDSNQRNGRESSSEALYQSTGATGSTEHHPLVVLTARMRIQTRTASVILWDYCHSEGQVPQTQRLAHRRGIQMRLASLHGEISGTGSTLSKLAQV